MVSEDHAAPTIGICVSYGIGFRLEPEGHTGFAHLFEHMMFERDASRAERCFIDRTLLKGAAALRSAVTLGYDFTEYIETAPVSALDRLLWLEADRIETLDFAPANLENQRKVVEEEVRSNVLNEPYGLFFAIDLPGKAYYTYPNAHNFYGDFYDLDAAKIEDVQAFYDRYYTPATPCSRWWEYVKPEGVFAEAEKYFSSVPSRPEPPRQRPMKPAQHGERRATEEDKLAKVPASAICISDAGTWNSRGRRGGGDRRIAAQRRGFAALSIPGQAEAGGDLSRWRI